MDTIILDRDAGVIGRHGAIKLHGPKAFAGMRAAVAETIERLAAAVEADYVVLGGGNAKKLGELPPNTRVGANENAFLGGFRLWNPAARA